MNTRVPKAWETTWAQEAIKAELDRPAGVLVYPGHDSASSEEVVYLVDRFGLCRAVDANQVGTEHWRVNDVKGAAKVPAGCSDQIIAAPARGSVAEFKEGYWVGDARNGEWRDEPYRAGCPGRARDVFDTMTDQTMRRGGLAPFTAAQVGAGRDYRELHERLASAGVKCSSAFDDKVRGQGRVDFMDAYMADAQRMKWFHEAIGDGVAKYVKRGGNEPSKRVVITDEMLAKAKKRVITVRTLVDDVCIAERPISDVLKANGWSAASKNRFTLYRALRAALGRMQGI